MSRDRLPKIDEWRFGSYRVTVHAVLERGLYFKGFRAKIVPRLQDVKAHGLKALDGDDLLKLKTEVEDCIAGMSDIVWSDYLVVELGDGDSLGGGKIKAGLDLTVHNLQEGVDSKGTKFFRMSETDNARRGTYDEYKKGMQMRGYDKDPHVVLPYSDETLETLTQFAAMLTELRTQISKFITKDKIGEVLERIRQKQPLALPMPVDIKSTKKKAKKKAKAKTRTSLKTRVRKGKK